jgi:hypothetical protein
MRPRTRRAGAPLVWGETRQSFRDAAISSWLNGADLDHRCLRDAFKAPPVRHSGERLLRADQVGPAEDCRMSGSFSTDRSRWRSGAKWSSSRHPH